MCSYLQGDFFISFSFLNVQGKKQKAGVAVSIPYSSLQLFTAVLCFLRMSETEGQCFSSSLAARQLIEVVCPLASWLMMCLQMHFHTVPGHKYPLRQTHRPTFKNMRRQLPVRLPDDFFSVRYVTKMAFWCKETWTREYLDTIETIPWSWSHVSFSINEGSSLFAPVSQKHDQQAIKF